MKKRYLFLMTLFVQLIMGGVAFAADPPKAEYDAAMAAIKDGSYYLFTEVDGIKYYVDHQGGLTEIFDENDREGFLFSVSKVSGGALYDVGILLDPGTGQHFSNSTLTDNKCNLTPGTGVFRLDGSNNRNDWERQVFYMNEEGKFAIRSCNTAFGESSWADAGRAFWTYEVDEAEEPVFYAEGALSPCYSYDPAYIWEFEAPEGKEVVYRVFNSIYTKYEDQIWDDRDDPTTLNMGTEFGQYTNWEAWYQLWDMLQEINAICDMFVDPDYVFEEDPEAPTEEQGEAYSKLADSLYAAILSSEVPYTMEDGYYRIYAVKRYKSTFSEEGFVDKAFAASFDKANHENKGVYGTVRKDLANFVWKLTKSETGDSILIQNAGMGTYISFSSLSENRVVMTDDASDASYVQFDYAGNDYVEPDGMSDYKDLFAIRLAGSERANGNYIHQNNHGSVQDDSSPWGAYETDRGADEELTFWNTTRSYDGSAVDKWTSEWYLMPVSEEEVAELVDAFGPIVNHELLVQKNQELRDKVLQTLTLAKDVTHNPMITSVNQLDNRFGDSSEGQNLGNLLDGDASTFWHTTWHGLAEGVDPFYYYGEGYEEGLECHYLQISGMDNLVGNCELYLRERDGADNDRVKTVVLMGTDNLKNEDDEWEEIARLTLPNTGKGEENTVPFYVETPYPYIRLFAIETASSSYAFRQFWHAAEIQLYTLEENPNSQFNLMGQVAQDLQDTYDANCATADEDITLEMYQALLDAYNAFLAAGLVDPAELRAALAAYAKVTEGVVEGQNPGQWSDLTVPNDFNALYAEVDAYNKAGKYDVAQIHKYAVMLKAMKKSVMETANVVKTDKWYRFMFPTEEMYDAYEFSKEGGDKTDLREDQATMFGTFVASGVEQTEETGEYNDDFEPITQKYVENLVSEDVRETSELHFFTEEEIQDPNTSLFRFVEKEAEVVDYVPLFQDAKDNMAMALDMSTTYSRVDTLITTASQFSSNASCQNNDGQTLASGCLIDGNASTYWHTDYQQKVLEIPYLQVALNKPVSGLIQVDITRRNTSNGHIVRMYIQGSEDAQTWTNVGYLETPYGSSTETVTSQPVDLGGTFNHLRFILTNRYGTDGGSNIEFDPFAEINGVSDWNVKWTYFHAAEFQIYSVVADKELSASAQAVKQAYTAANKILLKDATAEDLAAAAQAYKTFQTEFNTEQGKAVLPNGLEKVAPVYAIQSKATGLFINANNGNGGNVSYVYLKTIPTFFDYKAIGYERSLMHGTNINGSNPNYLHAGENTRRLCTWGSTEPQSNSGLVILEADEEYAAPESFTFFKDIKPGRIADWCNSVTITPVDAPEDAVAYTVVGQYTVGEDEDAETFVALKSIETIPAGDPALFIYGDTLNYDPEVDDDAEPVKFTMPGTPELVTKGAKVNGFVGTVVPVTLDGCELFFNGNFVDCKEGQGLTQCSAFLDIENCPQVDPDGDYELSIFLGQAAADAATGVKNVSDAFEKISQVGNVYSMDGKLLRTGATLNSVKAMGKGMYIFNGVKIAVK